MVWSSSRSFPRAILHIDGDSFFASCEVAKDPRLRGKPVITGKERGIVSACTYEAKRLGVKRGMRLFEVRRLIPDAVILPSDYETYSIFSARMYEIVRRYTPSVEEYSIDECFADLGGMRRVHKMSYVQIAEAIKKDLERELGMTFSIGVSATKVLAKIGSKWKKPAGLTVIPLSDAPQFLKQTPVGSVWGIGPNTTNFLRQYGVRTAQEFAERSDAWVRAHLSKPFHAIWHELRGELVYELEEGRETYQSISKTKTFTPPSRDAHFVFSQLSKNVESACIKARRWKLASSHIFFFLKTQDFKYHGCELRLSHATDVPHDILGALKEHFPGIFSVGGGPSSGGRAPLYRATGITLLKLQSVDSLQLDLFGRALETADARDVFGRVDEIARRFGKHTVFLASSLQARRFGAPASTRQGAPRRGGHLGERGDTPERMKVAFKGETARKRLAFPSLGEVG